MKANKTLESPPTLETERLILRKMTPGDAEAVFAYASDPEVTRYVSWEAHQKVEDSEAFLELVMNEHANGGGPTWGIVYKGDHRFVGTCAFVNREPDHARAEIGYSLARAYWGRGLMPEAVRAMIAFGFERMDLNRIEARCMAENEASARVMEKAGMSYEGTLRQREFIKGAYRDMKMYAVLSTANRESCSSRLANQATVPRRPG